MSPPRYFIPTPVLAASLAVAGLIGLVAAGLSAFDLEWGDLIRAMDRLDLKTVLALAILLPLLGFPISAIYLVIGARFGPAAGLGIVAVCTMFHLAGTHCIARGFLRRPLQRFLQRRHRNLPSVPPGANAAVAAMIMLAPAIPYFMRNYALALSRIPFPVYSLVALPLHVLRSYVALFLGDFGSSPTTGGLGLVVLVYAAQLSLCGLIAWHLRKNHRRPVSDGTPS